MRARASTIRSGVYRRRPFSVAAAVSGSRDHRLRVLCVAAGIVLGIMGLEWVHRLEFSLGVLYVIPIVIAATVLGRAQVMLAGVACAVIRGLLAPDLGPLEFWLRFLMASLAYTGIGLLVVEQSLGRRRMQRAYERVEREKTMRFRAEDRLRILADSSPAGIVTLDSAACVIAANRAAHEMFGVPADTLLGSSIAAHVPIFANALRSDGDGRRLRVSTSSWGKRADGVLFPITVWFSTYGAGEGRFLAGIIVDSSEEMRDREREAFRHFLDYNRLLAGAVSHEIRNMCSAIGVVMTNLARREGVKELPDFAALTQLTEGLGRIASFDLHKRRELDIARIDVHRVLDQLRVVIEPDWQEIGGYIHWRLAAQPLSAATDPHALLQVLLNLTQNALRAVQEEGGRPLLEIWTRREGDRIVISVRDAGPGVSDPAILFQPFRPEAEGSGLGLYVSRTLMRNLDGDLIYVPTQSGCQFDVELFGQRLAAVG